MIVESFDVSGFQSFVDQTSPPREALCHGLISTVTIGGKRWFSRYKARAHGHRPTVCHEEYVKIHIQGHRMFRCERNTHQAWQHEKTVGKNLAEFPNPSPAAEVAWLAAVVACDLPKWRWSKHSGLNSCYMNCQCMSACCYCSVIFDMLEIQSQTHQWDMYVQWDMYSVGKPHMIWWNWVQFKQGQWMLTASSNHCGIWSDPFFALSEPCPACQVELLESWSCGASSLWGNTEFLSWWRRNSTSVHVPWSSPVAPRWSSTLAGCQEFVINGICLQGALGQTHLSHWSETGTNSFKSRRSSNLGSQLNKHLAKKRRSSKYPLNKRNWTAKRIPQLFFHSLADFRTSSKLFRQATGILDGEPFKDFKCWMRSKICTNGRALLGTKVDGSVAVGFRALSLWDLCGIRLK